MPRLSHKEDDVPGHWMPVPSWDAEQPMECSTCGEIYVGRELGYLPIMCERAGCPGAGERTTVRVEPCGDDS